MINRKSPLKSRRIEIIECVKPNMEAEQYIIKEMTGEDQIIKQKKVLEDQRQVVRFNQPHSKFNSDIKNNKISHNTSNNYMTLNNKNQLISEINVKSPSITSSGFPNRYVNAMVTSEKTKDSVIILSHTLQKKKISCLNLERDKMQLRSNDSSSKPRKLIDESIIKGNDCKSTYLKIVRLDRRGVAIVRGVKKHRISFVDKIDSKQGVAEVINIESYKTYNVGNTYENSNRVKDWKSDQTLSCCKII